MLRPETVDIYGLLDRLRNLLSRTLDPRIVLRIDVQAGLAAPLADSAQLEVALLNLCLNARDAIGGRGGQLPVEAYDEMATLPGGQAPCGATPEHWIVFAVTDEGTGMDPATLARACEPFFTTKEVGKGSGLGLSMVQGFARQSGGEFQIESSLDVGTSAKVWLPQAEQLEPSARHREEEEQRAPSHPQGTGKPRRSGYVLLVDDDANVRDLIAEALQDAGFEVAVADRGEEALAMLRARDARFDALVTDFAMPGMTGGELLATVRREQPQLPGLIITGYAETALLGEIPTECKVLHKPFRSDDLVAHVVELLELVSFP